MKFHSILIVRDEGDIITECLKSALEWSDFIYVYDTGSSDQTWEIIQRFALQDKRVIPFKKEQVLFNDGLRAYVFEQFRHLASPGDWFIRLDADEFYMVTPPDFIKSRLNHGEGSVYHQFYEFRITKQDIAFWNTSEGEDFLNNKSIQDRLRWYIPLKYTEPRMFKYRPSMKWSPTASFPYNAGLMATERIPIRHYPHRSLMQLEKRLQARNSFISDEKSLFEHYKQKTSADFILDAEDNPNLLYWPPDQEIPEVKYTNHLESPQKRRMKHYFYRSFVSAYDHFKPSFPKSFKPDHQG